MSYFKRAIVCACALVLAQLANSQTVSGSKAAFSQVIDPVASVTQSLTATQAAELPFAKLNAVRSALADFLASANAAVKKAAVAPVSAAMNLVGSKYRWGGLSSRGGFDCSGFVKIVFLKQGITLPRTSGQQAYVGVQVKGSDLKPGDLVFFHTSRRSRITHVGIYAGNGKFIHAANSRKGVRIDSLSEAYYRQRLVMARRVGI